MKKLTLLLFFFLTLQANAKLLLEPYVGLGKSISDQIQEPNANFNSFSINPGVRIGMTTMFTFISFGGDFSYQSSTLEEDPSERELDLKRVDYSAFAAFEFPVLFRVFGKLIIASSLDMGETRAIDPSGYGLGIGFTGMPFLSMNLEYRNLTWNKVNTNETESSTDGEISEIILSLSLPFKI